LRERLRKLVTTPTLRVAMGAAGRIRYEKDFTLELTVKRTFAVYREVLDRRHERNP
jgi:hypothetical protein